MAHPDITWNIRDVMHAAERYRDAKAKSLNVNPSELVALGHIHRDGPITPNELAIRLDFTTGSVTALVDRLQAVDLIERNPNPNDRRSILITSTAAGRRTMERVYNDMDDALLAAMSEFSAGELKTVNRAIEQISLRLMEHAAATTG